MMTECPFEAELSPFNEDQRLLLSIPQLVFTELISVPSSKKAS